MARDSTASPVPRVVRRALLAVVMVLAACQQAPNSARTSTATVDTSRIVAVVKSAIEADYVQSMLPPGMTPGSLSDADVRALKSRITAAYEAYYTGPQLHDRISAMLEWADRMAAHPGLRTVVAEMTSFEGNVTQLKPSSATVEGTYAIHHVNESGSGTSLARWGGLVRQTYVAQLDQVGEVWLVANLSQRQLSFTPDPSLDAQSSPSE